MFLEPMSEWTLNGEVNAVPSDLTDFTWTKLVALKLKHSSTVTQHIQLEYPTTLVISAWNKAQSISSSYDGSWGIGMNISYSGEFNTYD
jgi:hypothetical protein